MSVLVKRGKYILAKIHNKYKDKVNKLIEISDEEATELGLTKDIGEQINNSHLIIENSDLVEINIPNSVTHLNIYNCTSLVTLNIPNSVTHLDINNCTSLNTLNIPNSVTHLKFGNCTSSITIPNSVQYLEINDSILTSLVIPNSVIYLEIFNITSLSYLTLNNNLQFIKLWCPKLTSITVPTSITTLGGEELWRNIEIQISSNNYDKYEYLLNNYRYHMFVWECCRTENISNVSNILLSELIITENVTKMYPYSLPTNTSSCIYRVNLTIKILGNALDNCNDWFEGHADVLDMLPDTVTLYLLPKYKQKYGSEYNFGNGLVQIKYIGEE